MATIDVTGGGSSKPDTGAKKDDALKIELDLTKDSLARGDKTSGLGRVFVQMDTNSLADDIADLALGALKARQQAGTWRIRIVDDAAVLRGADVRALLTHRANELEAALSAALPETQVPGSPLVTCSLANIVGAFPVIIPAVMQGVGVLSKLLAHDYQLSGKEVAVEGLGFDLLVAQKLMSLHPRGVDIAVERLTATDVTASAIFTTLYTLEERARTELTPLLTDAAATAAEKAALVASLTGQVRALQDQVAELLKHLDKEAAVSELTRTRGELTQIAQALTDAQERAARAQSEYDALRALAKDIMDFVTEAATTPADGRAPLVEAARAEAFAADSSEFILYVRLLTGGMDEILDARAFKSDTWTGLAGACAEFALLDAATVVVAGTRSVLEATKINLNNLSSSRQRIQYADVPGFTP